MLAASEHSARRRKRLVPHRKAAKWQVCLDVQAPWSTVFSWEFHALNNDVPQNGQRVTAQEAMDQEFALKGIPVELRPQLVGQGPADAS